MKKLLLAGIMLATFVGKAQDTTVVQTLTFDSTGRAYTFTFPDDSQSYRKVLMQYRLRCKGGLVSSGSNPNLGCGEWDYSCNTIVTDSSKTDSVKSVHSSHIISGFSGNSYNYTTNPTYTYYSYDQQEAIITGTTSEIVGSIGSGNVASSIPFQTGISDESKSQFLWTASELTTAGITAGDITGMRFDLSSIGTQVNFLKVRVKSTTNSTLDADALDLNGFTEVYFLNTSFLATGINHLNFYAPFNWDGTSNLIFELSYTNSAPSSPTSSIVNSEDTGLNQSLHSIASDGYLDFNGGNGYVDLDSLDLDYSNGVTFSSWVYFDGLNNWSRIFDIGNGAGVNNILLANRGGTNTLSFQVVNGSTQALELTNGITIGEWHHIAVTITDANIGSIYIDGNLETTGALQLPENLLRKRAYIGKSNWNSDGYFDGKLDDFQIWTKALDQATIEAWMNKEVNVSHPDYSDLVLNYDYNVDNGLITIDQISNEEAILNGGVNLLKYRGKDIFKNFSESTVRPNIEFVQGVYTQTINTVTILDSIGNSPNVVTEYQVSGSDIVEVGSNVYYQAGDMSIFDESGAEIGTITVPTQNTINITDLDYFRKFPSRFELVSFVTPYGIGLDLGAEGVMWEFDVTDFLPVLRDDKLLSVIFSAYQEEMDIRFLFIEGTPSRDVVDINNIWRAGRYTSYTDLLNNSKYEPRDVSLSPLASMYKIRAAITGHGQEGEFIPRTHYFNVNGGSNEVEWQVWKACGLNPVFPQGGTWVYDRAGWCPGMATDVKEYEIDPSAVSGNSVNIDYGIATASGTSNYIISSLLVEYGSPNFTNDASVIDIINPGLKTEHLRENPACVNPVITIQNTGSADLTSLKIEYKVSGGTVETFNWTGNLGFLKTEKLELPISGHGFWQGDDSDVIIVTVSNPNGVADESADNNTLKSAFEFPDWYGKGFIIHLKTNNNPSENSYVIKDLDGNVVHSKSNFAANTQYKDTIVLPSGCYTLEVEDTAENGLNWWAAAAQGNGYMRLKSIITGWNIKTFEPDFGAGFKYGFTLGAAVTIDEAKLSPIEFTLYPNPSSDKIFLSLSGISSKNLTVNITDVYGKSHYVKNHNTTYNMEFDGSIDVSNFANGIYFVEVVSGEERITKRIVVNK